MNHLFDQFVETFKPFLTKTYNGAPYVPGDKFSRWEAFEFIAQELLSRNKPLSILETGTLRTTNNWHGYGQSALLWDWLVQQTGGKGWSIDIDARMCMFARNHCKHLKVVCSDSVKFLREFSEPLDLLYLDSYDWSEEKQISSSLHHIAELASMWDDLPAGCLIAVDDCHNEKQGKHIMVRNFFRDMLGIEPIFNSYLTVWKKPYGV